MANDLGLRIAPELDRHGARRDDLAQVAVGPAAGLIGVVALGGDVPDDRPEVRGLVPEPAGGPRRGQRLVGRVAVCGQVADVVVRVVGGVGDARRGDEVVRVAVEPSALRPHCEVNVPREALRLGARRGAGTRRRWRPGSGRSRFARHWSGGRGAPRAGLHRYLGGRRVVRGGGKRTPMPPAPADRDHREDGEHPASSVASWSLVRHGGSSGFGSG